MTKKRDYAKPCHTLGYCPYGSLLEYFPLRGKAVQYNGKSLDIKPIEGEEGIACETFGHDCPVFYRGHQMCEDVSPTLQHKQENDYVLNEGHPSAWIEVGDLVVYIHTRDGGADVNGVIVDIMPLGDEDGDPLDTAIAHHNEE